VIPFYFISKKRSILPLKRKIEKPLGALGGGGGRELDEEEEEVVLVSSLLVYFGSKSKKKYWKTWSKTPTQIST